MLYLIEQLRERGNEPFVIYATPTTGKTRVKERLTRMYIRVGDTDELVAPHASKEEKIHAFEKMYEMLSRERDGGVLLTNLRYSEVLAKADLCVVGRPRRMAYHARLNRPDLLEVQDKWDEWEKAYVTPPLSATSGLRGLAFHEPTPGAVKTEFTVVLDHNMHLGDVLENVDKLYDSFQKELKATLS